MELAGKVGIVTGGCAGIGSATVAAFARLGALVIVGDISEPAPPLDDRIEFHRMDATSEADVAALVAAALAHGRLDFAVNNVGLSWGRGLLDLSEEDWDRTLAVSLKAPWLGLKHQIPAMIARGGGAIVNTASVAGLRATDGGNVAYTAAKAGVLHMTRYAAAAHARHNVRINSVSPGLTRTSIVTRYFDADQIRERGAAQPLGRIVDPDEVAEAIVWLCSARAAMVTGEDISVSGGLQIA